MIIEGNKIFADEGKVLRRKEDKLVVGVEYALGYTYYIGGYMLPEPKLEVPEDFEDLTEDEIKRQQDEQYPILVDKYIRERYTVSTEFSIQRQRDTKPEVFKEYFDFCEECKERARRELGMNE